MRATLARFESDRQGALAMIELYLNSPSGVGDHPDIVTELVNATNQLATAEESIEALQRHFLRPDIEAPEDDE
tara:strand:- start:1370 stop:1588 length:219 start_codon:yes stop_codon:yes gene_type:complete